MCVFFLSSDALTLHASGRLTNVQFTADLQDSSSPAYKNLSGSIAAEVGVCH